MNRSFKLLLCFLCGIVAAQSNSPGACPTEQSSVFYVWQATSPTRSQLAPALKSFKALFGGGNNWNSVDSFTDGYRTVSWDKPNFPSVIPGDYFVTTDPRGLELVPVSSQQEFFVSNDPSSSDNLFDSINPKAAKSFAALSPHRLFSYTRDTTLKVNFQVPGSPSTSTPAGVSGFGAVFVDVDFPESTKVVWKGADGCVIAEDYVRPLSKGLSFIGGYTEAPNIYSVEILVPTTIDQLYDNASDDESWCGTCKYVFRDYCYWCPTESLRAQDYVVLDDFIYGEPHSESASPLETAGGQDRSPAQPSQYQLPPPQQQPSPYPLPAPQALPPPPPPAPQPTSSPVPYPTEKPTEMPLPYPTESPTNHPSFFPTSYPTMSPTSYPTRYPVPSPTKSPKKTKSPVAAPTAYPTKAEYLVSPVLDPTDPPVSGPDPSTETAGGQDRYPPPSSPYQLPAYPVPAPQPLPPPPPPAPQPTNSPVPYPTKKPTDFPVPYPTKYPTFYPTSYPTRYPVPSPTSYPTKYPTFYPTSYPTRYPVPSPTSYPTKYPTFYPTSYPTRYPVTSPTEAPTKMPIPYPTDSPTSYPTRYPVLSPKTNSPVAPYSVRSPVLDPTDPPAPGPDTSIDDTPCIAVIDEASQNTMGFFELKWIEFRFRYPQRPFCLLQPEPNLPPDLRIPPNFINDPLTRFSTVSRDQGDLSQASDWFQICGLGSVATDKVAYFIDNSGSLSTAQVRASFDRLQISAASAGMAVVPGTSNNDEDWVSPFLQDFS